MVMHQDQTGTRRNHQACAQSDRPALAPGIGEASDEQGGRQFAGAEYECDGGEAGRRQPELVLEPTAERDDQRMAGSGECESRQQHQPAARDEATSDSRRGGSPMLGRLRFDPPDHQDRHHDHRRRAAEIPDAPVRRRRDEPHRADPDQQPERPRHLDQADHPAATFVRHVLRDPCSDAEIERRVSLTEEHQRDSQHGHALARRGQARPDDSRAEADRDRSASAEPIDDVPDDRRGQAEQFGDGNRHPDVGQLDVEAAGDRGDERSDEAVARVGGHPRRGEGGEVSSHLRRVRIIQHAAEHDVRL